jgi:hypothetical protein
MTDRVNVQVAPDVEAVECLMRYPDGREQSLKFF